MTDDANTQMEREPNIHGKPVLFVDTRILNPKSEFAEKLLCDGPTFSSGSSCVFTCRFCYVETMMNRGGSAVESVLKSTGKPFQDVVIRRTEPIVRLHQELEGLRPEFKARNLVAFASPNVDVAATLALAMETSELCKTVLCETNWTIRLLSKSPLISVVAKEIPETFKNRVIYGLSTGTLDDEVAKAIEPDAPPPSKRLEALAKLQDEGYRTFAMLCPILPQDPVAYAELASRLIDFSKCEHTWAEVLNRRGKSMEHTAQALEEANLTKWAQQLRRVFGTGSTPLWEAYARSMFSALTAVVPARKFRFLQYVTPKSLSWWAAQRSLCAVLLGNAKENHGHSDSEAAAPQQEQLTAKRSEAAKKAWITIRKNRAAQDAAAQVPTKAPATG